MNKDDYVITHASGTLMEKLDGEPRRDWDMTIQVALMQAYEAGHRVGYSSARKEGPIMMDSVRANILEEDRALSVPNADEKLEEEGYAFIHAIARKLAVLAKDHKISPEDVTVSLPKGIFGEFILNITFTDGV